VGRYGTGWSEMGRDPVIAVIVGSRDPATHLNYLYLSPDRRRFHFCISQLDASVIPWFLAVISSFYIHVQSDFLQTVAWTFIIILICSLDKKQKLKRFSQLLSSRKIMKTFMYFLFIYSISILLIIWFYINIKKLLVYIFNSRLNIIYFYI